jgi:molybdopterin-guanine dinucleotide biosynthesis protein MobB
MSACVIGVTGYSGSGKTTLIEKALPELKKAGLSVGVIKHTHHHLLNVDAEGKDTDRFYKSGADFVFAHDSEQGFARFPGKGLALRQALSYFPCTLDVILVEGHKGTGIPAVWLQAGVPGASPLVGMGDPEVVISRDDPECLEKFLGFVRSQVEDFHCRRVVRAGLLVGGRSSRMGTSKALLEIKGVPLVRKLLDTLGEVAETTALLGAADLPHDLKDTERLPDVPHVRGPMAGILSAFRWDPQCAWIISAVDMPLMHRDAWTWLLGQRRPGVWAVMPRLGSRNKAEAAGACYEPMIFEYVESLSGKGIFSLQEIAKHPRVVTPEIPESIARAWRNVNTPEDWKNIAEGKKRIKK